MKGEDDGDQSQDVAGDIFEAVAEVEAAVPNHELDHVTDAVLRRVPDLGVLGDELAGEHEAEHLVP